MKILHICVTGPYCQLYEGCEKIHGKLRGKESKEIKLLIRDV